jgi:formylglycine-generating enzyme required for sulfatase activity
VTNNKMIGKYEIIATLGQGGYGTVYRVIESILNVERALKVLHPVLMSDPSFIDRFRKEAQIMAKLEHPNIVPIYEMDQVGEHIYIAMKYMLGGSLNNLLLENKRLNFQRALEITQQIAEALEYGYQRSEQLVHCDIKPANILFDEYGIARLGDFGFAKLLSDGTSTSLSNSGGIVGTPAYIPPEIWDGRKASPATDVYSLACTFFEMITGDILFEGSTKQVIRKHIIDEPQFPKKWTADVPEGIAEVLKIALAKSVEDRYPRAKEFIESLERLAKKEKPEIIDEHDIPMVLIPKGSFLMGSEDGDDDEKPVHEVFLDEYHVDRYPVNNKQFCDFLNLTVYEWKPKSRATLIKQFSGNWVVDKEYEEHPVTSVSWYDARAYCEWRGGRLPTEAEWEKAARGGLVGKRYPWGDEKPICKRSERNGAQFNSCNGKTVPVGSFSPNGFGIYDMAGNVWEWVADWYDNDYYSKSEDENPHGSYTGEKRVIRGGSWDDDPHNLRVSYRLSVNPNRSYLNLGFRCVFGVIRHDH